MLWAIALAAICLSPTGSPSTTSIDICVLCGDRGAADGLLNALLYLPLGAYLRLRHGWPTWRSAAVCMGLSVTIEAAQLLIPGRVTSTGDIVWNTVGGVCGTLFGCEARRLMEGTARRSTVIIVCATIGLALIAPSALFVPSVQKAPLLVGWNPDLGAMRGYPGEVLSADMNGVPLRPSEEIDPYWLEESLLAGHRLRITFITAPTPTHMSPVFQLTDSQASVVLVAVRGPDVLIDLRTRATSLGLDGSLLRFPDHLRHRPPGDTVMLEAWWGSGEGLAVTLAGQGSSLAPRADRGWALLLGLGTNTPQPAIEDTAWIMLLAFMWGLAYGSHRAPAVILIMLLIAFSAVTSWTIPRPASAMSTVGGLVAFLAGVGLPVRRADRLSAAKDHAHR